MTEAIKVLDHGLVRLVEHMGSDLSIVRNARVSYDAEWRTGEDEGKDAKLINYLVKNRHTSPFESVNFTFEIKAPIFVFRQWHRHRTWCLSGDTKIEFVRPLDGKPYHKTIKQLADSWNTTHERKRNRGHRTQQEFLQDRIRSMKLRYLRSDNTFGETEVVDVWMSGVKAVYEVSTSTGRTIKASADHKFLTPEGYLPVAELLGKSVCVRGRAGTAQTFAPIEYSDSEVWAATGYEGYEVSTHGNVRSFWSTRRITRNSKLKKLTVNSSGRTVVSIANKTKQVSQLVATAFVPSDIGQDFVCHKDGNPQNNHASNLYWGDAKTNQADSTQHGTRSVRAPVFEVVSSVTPVGECEVYDMTVAAEEHNFIANGFIVHNCYNEISARYAELPEEYYIPDLNQITTQSTSNKQMRTTEVNPQAKHMRDLMAVSNAGSFHVYKELLSQGCPRELARSVLPVGTYSHMFATVDLHNLMHFLKLRLHSHSQYEIRVYAEAMLQLIEPIVPHSVAAFKEHILEINNE